MSSSNDENVRYRRVSKGVHDFKLVPLDDKYETSVNRIINKYPDSDFYETIYEYNQEHFNKFENTKSVAGFTGLTTKRLIFDFDHKKETDKAKADAVELASRLISHGVSEDNIRIYFSGNKGFHVEVHTDEYMSKSEVDNIIGNMTTGLETVDKKILDENRLFRLPLTFNKGGGLHKIPLTLKDLSDLSINDIRDKAILDDEKLDHYGQLIATYKTAKLPEAIVRLKNLTKQEKKELDENKVFEHGPDPAFMPVFLSKPMGALLQGFFEEGERNDAMMILATNMRKVGMPKDVCYNMLKSTLRNRAMRLGLDGYDKDELYKTIIEPVYSPRWKGGIYTEDNALVQKTIERYNLQAAKSMYDFKTPEDITKSTIEFLSNLQENRVYTGIDELDNKLMLTKGMMVGVLGAPSSGKTSFVNNFVEYTSLIGNKSLYLSLDMAESLLTIRMLGKYTNKSMRELEEMVRLQDPTKEVAKGIEKFHTNFKNVTFNFRNGLTVDDIENMIITYKQEAGDNLTMVAVDYLEKIRSHISDPTASSAFIAARLADIAKTHNVCLVLLLQPQKMAGGPEAPLLSFRRIKGSSVLEQDCRAILTMWRPGFNPDRREDDPNYDKYTSIAIVKQNMGEVGRMDFLWEGKTGVIKSMNRDEKLIFQDDMEEVKKLKEASKQPDEDLY